LWHPLERYYLFRSPHLDRSLRHTEHNATFFVFSESVRASCAKQLETASTVDTHTCKECGDGLIAGLFCGRAKQDVDGWSAVVHRRGLTQLHFVTLPPPN
jgi:predicted RNA-binding Zn-ribbon protein involved in translation (DUF1610 family)